MSLKDLNIDIGVFLRYEGANAELPRLIQTHEEEIRFLTEKNKQLRKNVRELNEQLKHKSDELQSLQEQLKHYEKLDKDKHLLEREKLIEELEDVKRKLSKTDSEIVILNRKLALESKISKQRLNTEMAKHKQCQKDLAQALVDISKLTKMLEVSFSQRCKASLVCSPIFLDYRERVTINRHFIVCPSFIFIYTSYTRTN